MPQVSSPHAAGFVHMRKASFDALSTLTQQPLSALAPDPPTILVNRRLLFLLALPVAAPAVRLGTIAPNLHFLQNHQHVVTVIALIQHQLRRTFRIHLPVIAADIACHFPDMFAALRQRFVQRIGITRRRGLQGHSQHCARFQIHRMLSFVGQVRTAIFHLRDLRIGVVRVLPVIVIALFLPLAVQLCQLLTSRRLDAGFLSPAP